ncbi:MAG: hypothetical protein Q4F29_13140 [Lachnospiraceae bacterium]|nr:hypothetical protein [Lachnospiraceae bacterium]
MNGMEMGYDYNPIIYGDKRSCPAWVSAEQFYNCENFFSVLGKKGFDIDRLFRRSSNSDIIGM